MKPEHWIQIAAIIVALMTPWLNEWAKLLIANPSVNQPDTFKNRIRRRMESGNLINYLNLLSFVASLGLLVWQLFSKSPLTRYSVFIIAGSTCNLYWLIISRVLDDHAQALRTVLQFTLEHARKRQEIGEPSISTAEIETNSKEKTT